MRLIDADNVPVMFDAEFKKTKKLILEGETHLDNLAEGFAEAIHVIRAMQTIDAVPVVHAQWIENESGIIICPECKRGYNLHAKYAHYCPSCGARMDGGDDHET